MTVLVCEREGATALLIRQELEACGYGVVSAQNEDEALDALRNEGLDLILLDGLGIGLSALATMRATPQGENLPVVVLTANPEPSATYEAYQAGADMVLTKPFNPRELVTFRPRD